MTKTKKELRAAQAVEDYKDALLAHQAAAKKTADADRAVKQAEKVREAAYIAEQSAAEDVKRRREIFETLSVWPEAFE